MCPFYNFCVNFVPKCNLFVNLAHICVHFIQIYVFCAILCSYVTIYVCNIENIVLILIICVNIEQLCVKSSKICNIVPILCNIDHICVKTYILIKKQLFSYWKNIFKTINVSNNVSISSQKLNFNN